MNLMVSQLFCVYLSLSFFWMKELSFTKKKPMAILYSTLPWSLASGASFFVLGVFYNFFLNGRYQLYGEQSEKLGFYAVAREIIIAIAAYLLLIAFIPQAKSFIGKGLLLLFFWGAVHFRVELVVKQEALVKSAFFYFSNAFTFGVVYPFTVLGLKRKESSFALK